MIRQAAAGKVRLLATHRDSDAPVLEVADEAFIEPRFGSDREAHVAWCLDFCRTHRVALFVPGFDRRHLAPHIQAFEAVGTKLMLPADAAMLALLHDKTGFTAAAKAADLPLPWTREVRDVDGYDAAIEELTKLGVNACVKPPAGVFGAGFWRLDQDISRFAALMNPDARVIPPIVVREALAEADGTAALLVMEHLPGDEWSIDILCDAGRIVVGVSRRKLGRAQLIEIDGPVFAIARNAVALFGLSGLINLQCKAAGEDGDDPRLLEINARMSGGCLYTLASGVNLPWWHVALALGIATENDVPLPVGGARVISVTGSISVNPERSVLQPAAAHA